MHIHVNKSYVKKYTKRIILQINYQYLQTTEKRYSIHETRTGCYYKKNAQRIIKKLLKIKKKSDSRKQNSENVAELSQRSSPWRAQKICSWKICEKNIRNLKVQKVQHLNTGSSRRNEKGKTNGRIIYGIIQEYFHEPKNFH